MHSVLQERTQGKSTLSSVKDRLWKHIATPPALSTPRHFSRKGLMAGYWLVYFQGTNANENSIAFSEITCPWIEKIMDKYSSTSGQELWDIYIDYLVENGAEDYIIEKIENTKYKYFKTIVDGLRRLSSFATDMPSMTYTQKARGEWFATNDQRRFSHQSFVYMNEMIELGRRDAVHMAEQIWNMCVAQRSKEERCYISINSYLLYENMIQAEMVKRMTKSIHIIIFEL